MYRNRACTTWCARFGAPLYRDPTAQEIKQPLFVDALKGMLGLRGHQVTGQMEEFRHGFRPLHRGTGFESMGDSWGCLASMNCNGPSRDFPRLPMQFFTLFSRHKTRIHYQLRHTIHRLCHYANRKNNELPWRTKRKINWQPIQTPRSATPFSPSQPPVSGLPWCKCPGWLEIAFSKFPPESVFLAV